jgi:Holliday junction resolvase RusA-like endonuclease
VIVRFVVDAEPAGKLRHRSTRTGHTYNPPENTSREAEVRSAWRDQDGRTFERGVPLEIELVAWLARPSNHYTRSGLLNASGTRAVLPTKKPDWDNLGKLVADALNKYAYHDDAQIVVATVRKRWCDDAQTTPCTAITLRSLA